MSTPERLEELLLAYLDGTLDEAGQQELARLLRAAPEARERLRSYLQVEGALLDLARAHCLEQDSPTTPVATAGKGGPVLPLSTPAPRFGGFSWRLARNLTALAATVALAVGLWYGLTNRPPAKIPVIARVTAIEGDLEIVNPNGETRPAHKGQPIHAGDTLRTADAESFAVLEHVNQVRLELSPETAIRFPSKEGPFVQLLQGVLRGSVPEPAAQQPLVVATPGAQVRVQGERFVFSSAAAASSRVDVEAGTAEVVRQTDQQAVTVESGASVLVRAEPDDMVVEAGPRFVTEPRRVLGFAPAKVAAFERDGQHILASSFHELWRFGPGPEPEKTILTPNLSEGRAGAFSRDGRTLAIYSPRNDSGAVVLWDLPTRQRRLTIETKIGDRQFFALAPDVSWLATVDTEQSKFQVHLWDATTGQHRTTVTTDVSISCLAASPTNDLLAVGLLNNGQKKGNRILLLDPRTSEQRGVLPTNAYPLTRLAFSPDGRCLAAGITGQVQLWDVEQRQIVRTIRGFERVLSALVFSPDGQRLAGGTQDGQVWLWDVERGTEIQVIQAGPQGVRLLAFSPDGRSLLTGDIKRYPLMLWDLPAPPKPPPVHQVS